MCGQEKEAKEGRPDKSSLRDTLRDSPRRAAAELARSIASSELRTVLAENEVSVKANVSGANVKRSGRSYDSRHGCVTRRLVMGERPWVASGGLSSRSGFLSDPHKSPKNPNYLVIRMSEILRSASRLSRRSARAYNWTNNTVNRHGFDHSHIDAAALDSTTRIKRTDDGAGIIDLHTTQTF